METAKNKALKKGILVMDIHTGIRGVIVEKFDNWCELKSNYEFGTIDPVGESDNMDDMEKLINGDPKDKWLTEQEVPFTMENQKEAWFEMERFGKDICEDDRFIWSCASRLKVVTETYDLINLSDFVQELGIEFNKATAPQN